jgi:hypothetical protein
MNDTAATPFRVLLATDDSEAARNAEAWVSRLRWSRPCVVDEPDAVLVLATYVFLLGALWRTST